MKKTILCVLFSLIFAFLSFAENHLDISKHGSCKYCGMDRNKYSHSRMLIVYEDGSEVATCSIHCTAVELAVNIDKNINKIYVADYYTKKLIDTETAFWVIGGNIPGVMTKNAKWAFEKKEDAEIFIKKNGGKLASFDEALKATYSDMYSDIKMIRDKRKKMKGHGEQKHGHSH